MGAPSEGEKIDKKTVEDFFDKTALLHQNANAVLDVSPGEETAHANIYRDYFTKSYLRKYVSPSATDVILDFGCGVGRVTFYFAPIVKEIKGIDLSSQMIEVAKSAPKPGNVEFTWLKSSPFPYPDKTFSKIFTNWVMQHIPDSEVITYLKEFNRILKDGGKIFLFEQVKNELTKTEQHIYRTAEQYKQLIRAAGFNHVIVKNVMRVPSRGMSLWMGKIFGNKLFLPLLRTVDNFTINRKPQFAGYYTAVFIFEKKS